MAPELSPGPRHGRDIPFEVVQEGWSVYTLGPGSALQMRVRAVLLYLLESPAEEGGPPSGTAGLRPVVPVAQTIVVLHPSPDSERDVNWPQDTYAAPGPEDLEAAPRRPLPVNLLRKGTNEYLVRVSGPERIRLRTEIVVDAVYQLGDLRDPLGLPLVSLESRLTTSQWPDGQSPPGEDGAEGPTP
jgi:hypothetical protein